MHFRVQLLSVVAARLGVSVGRAIAGATDPRLDASVGRVIAGAMASAGQRPMVVRPSELTQPGRLDGAKRLLGRLVEVEHVPNARFGCYLVCGHTARDVIAIEAWRELAEPAASLLKASCVVSLTQIALSRRQASKAKYTHSQCDLFVRFDKGAGVEEETTPPLELPAGMPCTPLHQAACWKDGLVNVRAEVTGGFSRATDDKDRLFKLTLRQPGKAGEFSEAEVLAWGELATAAEQVPRPAMMELRNLAVTKHAKNGFTLKWLKQTAACALPAVEAEELRANMAGRERCKTLSLRAGGAAARDYGAGPATLVSLATLGAFLPAAEAKKFSHEDVWEAPFCTLAHLQTLSRVPEDSWHYTGCATCFRKTCDKHDEAGVRPCYSLEATVWDHTATLDARIFTKCVDEVLRAALAFRPGDAVQSQENAEHEIRARKWAVRFVVAHDEAYSGPTGSRAARNTLQVVHVREAPLTYSGSAKPLLCLRAAASLPGCPCIYLSDATLDDAGQITAGEDLPVQYAELLLRITTKDPVQECNEAERGVRIIFECADATQPDIRADLTWVVSVRDSLAIARQRPDTLLRVVAKPHVLFDTDGEPSLRHWQVIFQFPAADADIEPFARRRAWQLSLDSQPSLKIKRLQEDAMAMTPLTKVAKVKEALTSPSFRA